MIIYSPHPEEMTSFIVKEFRQRTGIIVRVITNGTGVLLQKLAEEQSNPKADILWGGGAESLEASKTLFEPFDYPEKSILYKQYFSPENLWQGFTLMPMVIMYNTQLVDSGHSLNSWKSLLNEYYKNRILMASPERSGSSFSILCTLIYLFPDAHGGWGYIENLLPILGKKGIVQNSSEVYRAISMGEMYAGFTFENAVLQLQSIGKPVAVVYPKEGTAIVPDGIAIIKNAKHRANAEQFITFALSKDVQGIVRSRWFRRSIRRDIPPPEGTPQLEKIQTIDYSIERTAQNREAILANWQKITALEASDTSVPNQ